MVYSTLDICLPANPRVGRSPAGRSYDIPVVSLQPLYQFLENYIAGIVA
jgi:hypothetical protein